MANTWNIFSDICPALVLFPYPSKITDTEVLTMQKGILLYMSGCYLLVLFM